MSNRIEVYNLAESNREPAAVFLDVPPAYAVAYCYAEQTRQLSRLFSLSAHNPRDENAYNGAFPIHYGRHSIACGDFAALR